MLLIKGNSNCIRVQLDIGIVDGKKGHQHIDFKKIEPEKERNKITNKNLF